MPAAPLVKLPDAISCETAAAMMMRGLTAAYLTRRTYPLKPGDTILLQAAAGGVGLIVCQWAKLLGATVIGTVSSAAKAEIARGHGCDHIIDYTTEDVAKRVRELTDGVGVHVVYDGVGKDTFAGSIDSLRRRGLMVCLGTASGPLAPFDPFTLALKGSLFLTRPAAADYVADRSERRPRRRAVRPCRFGADQDRNQPALRPERCGPGASRPARAQDDGIVHLRRLSRRLSSCGVGARLPRCGRRSAWAGRGRALQERRPIRRSSRCRPAS